MVLSLRGVQGTHSPALSKLRPLLDAPHLLHDYAASIPSHSALLFTCGQMAYRGNNMLTYPSENDHTEYFNSFESTDGNVYPTISQPLAPLVTPLAAREWKQLGIRPYIDATTPASTASLNSPRFTRPSSFGSSVVCSAIRNLIIGLLTMVALGDPEILQHNSAFIHEL